MDNLYAFYEGKIVKEEDIKISIRSKVFNYGLGCFEGIRAYWNEDKQQLYVFRLKDHFERLLNSCKILNLNIPYTAEQLSDFTVELLKKNNINYNTYIRPVVYKGAESLLPTLSDDDNRIVIYCENIGKSLRHDELRVGTSTWRRVEDNMIPIRVKPTGGYLNSALASLEASKRGYDEAILLNNLGKVCEGTGENIFIVKHNKLITPPASDNILEGITRRTLIEVIAKELGMEVIERSISRNELYDSDEVFFTGTAVEVVSITEIDDRIIGTGKTGEICLKIKERMDSIFIGENEKYHNFVTKVY